MWSTLFHGFSATLLLVAVSSLGSSATALSIKSGHPVEGVISLLKGLQEQVEEEAKSEALTFQKFEYWCANSKKTLEKTISEEKVTLESLSSEIASHEKNIEVLDEQISSLETELGKLADESTKADTVRTSGTNLFSDEEQALSDTITAISSALTALESAKTTTDSGAVNLSQQRVQAVLALLETGLSATERGHLEKYISHREGLSNSTVPRPILKAAGDYDDHTQDYSFKSSSVIELLKGLKIKFEEELRATVNAETNAENAHLLAKAARDDLVAAAMSSKSAKESEKQAAELALSTAEQSFRDTQSDLTSDSDTLGTTTQECRVKKSEWEKRSETRTDEREAIKAAISILAKASGVRTEAPANPMLPVSPVQFLQLSSSPNPNTKKAVQLLRAQAQTAHSKAIEQLAEQVATQKGGHFDEVVNVIEKMIFRLMKEQKEEDDHKNWCDKEIEKTNVSIEDKEDKISELTVKIEAAMARVGSLASEIETANIKVSEISKYMTEATEIRNIGKRENALAVADAQKAQTALANAIAVLKDFYKESGAMPKASWEFLQRRREPVSLDAKPATWAAGYIGVADPANQPDGIVSVLEKVSADFAQMESETVAQEGSDQIAYQEDMKSSEIEKARHIKEAEMKAKERTRLVEKQQTMEASRKGVLGEKEATVQYLQDLQPACVEGSSTYTDRKAARSQEVTALKEAQTLLQDAFTNQTNQTSSSSFLQMRRRA